MKLILLDYTTFFVYIGLLFLFVYYKQKKIEVEDFLISKRNLGIMENMMSINASKTGAILIGYTALAYIYGIAAIWYFIGIVLGYLIFIPFGAKLYKIQDKKYYTLGEYFYKNYNKKIGIFVTFLCSLLMFGFLCINLVGSAKVLSLFLPIPYYMSVILIIFIIWTYVVGTGFKSVIKTDIIQYLAIFLVIIGFGSYLLFNNINLISDINYNLFNIEIKNVIGFFLIGILYPFSQPELFQRIYASKSIKVFKKSMIYSITLYFGIALILTLISLLIVSLYPNIDPDTAFVTGLYNLLPIGINGFLMVILFAAFMSSLDTYIYTASSSIVQDLFKLNKNQTKKYIRLVISLISLLSIIIAITYSDVINLSFVFVGLTIILGLTVLITWIKPKISTKILFLSSIGGFSILVFSISINLINNTLSPSIVIYGFLGFLISFLLSSLFFKLFPSS